MSNSSLRLIRAVRILPEAVRIGSVKQANHPFSGVITANKTFLEEDNEEYGVIRSQLNEKEATCKSLEQEISDLRERQILMEEDLHTREEVWFAEKKSIEARVDLAEEEARKEGFSQGYKEGNERGLNEGKDALCARITQEKEEEVSGVVALLNCVHQELQKNLEALLDSNSSRLIRLWQKTLSKILVKEVEFDKDSALRILKDLLSRASEKEDVRVYLNPGDIDYIEDKKKSLGDSIRSIRNIEFIPDDDVDPGSCLVETGLGVYDARWRTQLEQIGAEVEEVLTEGWENEG